MANDKKITYLNGNLKWILVAVAVSSFIMGNIIKPVLATNKQVALNTHDISYIHKQLDLLSVKMDEALLILNTTNQ